MSSALSHKSYDVQLFEYYPKLNNIIITLPEGKYRNIIYYLSHIISPTSKCIYDINGTFLELFVDHYYVELSALIMPARTLTHELYHNLLIEKFGDEVSDMKDIFGDVLQYLGELRDGLRLKYCN